MPGVASACERPGRLRQTLALYVLRINSVATASERPGRLRHDDGDYRWTKDESQRPLNGLGDLDPELPSPPAPTTSQRPLNGLGDLDSGFRIVLPSKDLASMFPHPPRHFWDPTNLKSDVHTAVFSVSPVYRMGYEFPHPVLRFRSFLGWCWEHVAFRTVSVTRVK